MFSSVCPINLPTIVLRSAITTSPFDNIPSECNILPSFFATVVLPVPGLPVNIMWYTPFAQLPLPSLRLFASKAAFMLNAVIVSFTLFKPTIPFISPKLSANGATMLSVELQSISSGSIVVRNFIRSHSLPSPSANMRLQNPGIMACSMKLAQKSMPSMARLPLAIRLVSPITNFLSAVADSFRSLLSNAFCMPWTASVMLSAGKLRRFSLLTIFSSEG